MQTFRGVDEVAWLWGDQLYVSLLFWAPHLQGSICLPAALPDRLSLSPSLTLGLGGLLPTAVCSLWEISIAFELVIGSKVSDSHYYKAAFTAAAFQVASEAALSCHQSVLCGHDEDRFLKRKGKKIRKELVRSRIKEIAFETTSTQGGHASSVSPTLRWRPKC